MQSALVFLPVASPTYVPFGLAVLVSHLHRTLPHQQIELFDFNLSFWQQLSADDPEGQIYLNFVHDRSTLFYDPTAYSTAYQIRNKLFDRINRLSQKAKRFIEHDETDPELAVILESQAKAILASAPRLIGFSVMYLDQLNFSLALAKYLRNLDMESGMRIVFGGASMTALNPEELLQACPCLDGIILGEGETGLTALLSGKTEEEIPGLLYRSEGGLIKNQGSRTAASHLILKADYSHVDLSRYFNPETVLTVVYSRDCDWGRCRFCAHNVSFSGFRKRSVNDFVDDLEALNRDFGVSYFYFADQYIPAEDLELIAIEILKRNLRIAYHVMCRPLASYTPKRLETIALSGCRWISWGVESGSQRLLDLVKKGTEVAAIEAVLRDAAGVGISNLAMMIFGLPTSSDIDMWQTFALLEKSQDYLDAINASSYVLYDKTYFGRKPERFGISVSGVKTLLEIGHTSIHSTKFQYKELASNGSLRPPRGSLEVIEWEKRRTWMKEMTFLESLPCEHYLLYANHNYEKQRAPDKPFTRSA